MTEFTIDLKVCTDCAHVIANGWSNFNENYPEGYSETNARREDIERGLAKGYWIVDSDYGDIDFSSKPCDLCRSRLAGSRYGAAIVERAFQGETNEMKDLTREYVVIENVTGYMPDDDDPFTTNDYEQAVEVLRSNMEVWRDDPDVLDIQDDWASGDNLSAYRIIRRDNLLDVVGEILILETD